MNPFKQVICNALVSLGLIQEYTITVEKESGQKTGLQKVSLSRTLYRIPTGEDFKSLEDELDELIGRHFPGVETHPTGRL